MTPALTYALGAMLCFGIGDLIYKQGAAAGAPAHHFLMVQTWFFGPLVLTYALVTHGLFWNPGTLWGGLAGLFMLTGFYNFARSLKTGSISINAPVFRLSFVLTAVLAVLFLGEPLTAHKIAGIALALVAAWLLLGAPAKGAEARRESRAALLRVLFATTMVGLGNFIYKFGLMAGANPASMIVMQAAMVIPAATLFVALVDGRIRPAPAVLRYAPRAGLALATAFTLQLEALARGDASAVVPVAQMGFVVTALIGMLFLKEAFTVRKGAGLIAALAALASLALG